MLWFYKSAFPAIWILFILYWQIKAAHTKTTQRVEEAASRLPFVRDLGVRVSRQQLEQFRHH